jgi:hypothetical protein
MSLVGLSAVSVSATELQISWPSAENAPVTLTRPVQVEDALPPVPTGDRSRGFVLPSLYASFIAFQVYDGYTTLTDRQRGVGTLNPLTQGISNRLVLRWAIKAGITHVVSITTAEHLWRQHHRGQAIALMVVSNGIMAAIAVRNTSVLRGHR